MTALLIITAIVVFCVAVASPKKGRTIEDKTNHGVNHLHKKVDRFWDPLTHLMRGGLRLFQLGIKYIVKWATGLRRKLPF